MAESPRGDGRELGAGSAGRSDGCDVLSSSRCLPASRGTDVQISPQPPTHQPCASPRETGWAAAPMALRAGNLTHPTETPLTVPARRAWSSPCITQLANRQHPRYHFQSQPSTAAGGQLVESLGRRAGVRLI